MNKENIKLLNRQFHLSESQWKKYFDWVDSLPEKYYGATSDGISFVFDNCSLGVIVKAVRDEGEEIDLTDWDNFD
jgi:hypothetical protein